MTERTTYMGFRATDEQREKLLNLASGYELSLSGVFNMLIDRAALAPVVTKRFVLAEDAGGDQPTNAISDT